MVNQELAISAKQDTVGVDPLVMLFGWSRSSCGNYDVLAFD